MPRLGGLAIYLSFVVGFFLFVPKTAIAWGIFLGGSIIALVGALDDRFQLSPKAKLLGQLVAALVVVAFGLRVTFINLPFDEGFSIGWLLSIPVTMVWIVAVTNAVNLIDGLDGLAAGVSAIATATLLVVSLLMGNTFVALLCAVLLGATMGFLVFNFHPAKIFMGDTGALFLGFQLAVLSIMGFKQVTLFSYVIPLLLLGVPLSDTFFAIVRRKLNKKPISAADKSHLHHCLLHLGLSHRGAVLTIYAISALFGLCAVLLYQAQAVLWVATMLVAVLVIALQLGAEVVGLIGYKHKPLLRFLRRVRARMQELVAGDVRHARTRQKEAR
ncbi:MAG: undecaprenyl/decaprenyl-phosphate alpha-N-acetylglucosaminyl 1-phosphate transferase, partial [Calditerricola sp.]|nr:undecaprenyl/decaprenyl-phosphate alpha-N-acetylglucosaminyl 1-phosphate transferase [Calditerricola sp.]